MKMLRTFFFLLCFSAGIVPDALAQLQIGASGGDEGYPVGSSMMSRFAGAVPDTFAQLRIVAPNGGEDYPVGSSVTIRWTGVPSSEQVRIEYSTDGGGIWNLITDRGTGLQHLWRPVPNTPSSNCLLRINSSAASTDSVLYLPSEFITGQRELIFYAEFSKDGSKVIGTSSNGHVFIWDAFTKAVLLAIQAEPPENPTSFTQPISPARFSPDGNSFAVVGPFKTGTGSFIRIYNATTGAIVREWSREQFREDQTVTCAYSPDGTKLLVTGERYGLVFNVSDGSQTALLKGYSDSGFVGPNYYIFYGLMTTGEWTQDGAVIAGWDIGSNRIVFSNSVTGDTIKRFSTEPTLRPEYLRYSPDNTRLIATGFDFGAIPTAGQLSPRVKIWDTATGTEALVFSPFARFTRWADYSEDGSYIAAVGSDASGQPESLKILDPLTGVLRRVVATHQGNMFTVDMGPDPDRILVACNDGARIYQAPTVTADQFDVSDALWSISRSSGEIVTLSIPSLESRQGAFIDAPLVITNPSAALSTGATQIDVNLSFNATLLDPVGATPKGTIVNGVRTIPISVPLSDDTLLTTLRFRAALGNDSTTALDLDNAQADVPSLTIVENDGEFRLLDLCYAGGARLVNPDGLPALRIVRTDPASGSADVEFRIPSGGSVLLFLSDMEGRRVRTFLQREMDGETYRAALDLRGLPSAGYFLVLQTAADLQTVRMEVGR